MQTCNRGGEVTTATVIIPAFNARDTILLAIESALNQHGVSTTVVVIDDGSQDGTADVVDRALGDVDGLELIRLPDNMGPSYARNLGMQRTAGEWVAFLDADDIWTPDRLVRMTDAGRDFAADIVSDDVLLQREGARFPWTTMYELYAWDRSGERTLDLCDFLSRDWILQPIVRRKFLLLRGLTFAEDIRHGEDFLFYGLCLLNGSRWITIPTAHYVYIKRDRSITSTGRYAQDHLVSNHRLLDAIDSESSSDSLLKAMHSRVRRGDVDSFVRSVREVPALRRPVEILKCLFQPWTILFCVLQRSLRPRTIFGRLLPQAGFWIDHLSASSNGPVSSRSSVIDHACSESAASDLPLSHDLLYFVYPARDYVILLPADDHMTRKIHSSGRPHEYLAMLAFESVLPASPKIVDVGANVGSHSLFWAASGGLITAYESNPEALAYLERSVAANSFLKGAIDVRAVAVGDSTSSGSIEKRGQGNPGHTAVAVGGQGDIQTVALDDEDFTWVDGIKIDVDGSELQAILGALDLIRRCRPAVMLECWRLGTRGPIDRLMKDLGYYRFPLRIGGGPTYLYLSGLGQLWRAATSFKVLASASRAAWFALRRWGSRALESRAA